MDAGWEGLFPGPVIVPDPPPVDIVERVSVTWLEQWPLAEAGDYWIVRLTGERIARPDVPRLPWSVIAERTWPGNPFMAVCW